MARAKDALLHHGRKQLDRDRRARRDAIVRSALQELAIVSVPLLVFMLGLLLSGAAYHYAPVRASLALLALLVGSVVAHDWLTQESWQRWLGRALLFSSWAGVLIGLYVYYTCWLYYYSYRDLNRFANVAAGQPASAFGDAGMIQFSEDTRVDVDRSVGYVSLAAGETFCVAPLIDGTMGTGDNISFYAAGLNCCNSRGGFRCDDAGQMGARSALLLLEPERLLSSPFMTWVLSDSTWIEGFQGASKLQQAVFGTKAGEDCRFLRWAKDPIDMQNAYLRRAFAICGVSAAVQLVLLLLGGGLVLFQPPPPDPRDAEGHPEGFRRAFRGSHLLQAAAAAPAPSPDASPFGRLDASPGGPSPGAAALGEEPLAFGKRA